MNSFQHQPLTFFSRLTFSWFSSLMYLGYQKTLTVNDLYPLTADNTTEQIENHFRQNLIFTSGSYDKKNKLSPNLARVLAKSYGGLFVIGALFHLAVIILQFATPQLLK